MHFPKVRRTRNIKRYGRNQLKGPHLLPEHWRIVELGEIHSESAIFPPSPHQTLTRSRTDRPVILQEHRGSSEIGLPRHGSAPPGHKRFSRTRSEIASPSISKRSSGESDDRNSAISQISPPLESELFPETGREKGDDVGRLDEKSGEQRSEADSIEGIWGGKEKERVLFCFCEKIINSLMSEF